MTTQVRSRNQHKRFSVIGNFNSMASKANGNLRGLKALSKQKKGRFGMLDGMLNKRQDVSKQMVESIKQVIQTHLTVPLVDVKSKMKKGISKIIDINKINRKVSQRYSNANWKKHKSYNRHKSEEALFYSSQYQFFLRKGQEWSYVEFQNRWNKKQAIHDQLKRYHILEEDNQGDKYTPEMDKRLKALPLEVLEKLDAALETLKPKSEGNKKDLMKKLSSTSLVTFLHEKDESDCEDDANPSPVKAESKLQRMNTYVTKAERRRAQMLMLDKKQSEENKNKERSLGSGKFHKKNKAMDEKIKLRQQKLKKIQEHDNLRGSKDMLMDQKSDGIPTSAKKAYIPGMMDYLVVRKQVKGDLQHQIAGLMDLQ